MLALIMDRRIFNLKTDYTGNTVKTWQTSNRHYKQYRQYRLGIKVRFAAPAMFYSDCMGTSYFMLRFTFSRLRSQFLNFTACTRGSKKHWPDLKCTFGFVPRNIASKIQQLYSKIIVGESLGNNCWIVIIFLVIIQLKKIVKHIFWEL